MTRIHLLSILTLLPTLVLGDAASLVSCLSSSPVQPVTSSSSAFSSDTAAFNQRLQPVPAAILYPKTPQDISAAVICASQAGVNVSARSGGHSYASYSLGGYDGSLVIDLSAFNTVTVESDGTAVVGAGNRLGNIALRLNDAGKAIPHGTCPMVGIGGHAGMGGFGLASRQWGLTVDNIVAFDVVLANGTVVTHLTPNVDADLFWAMAGSAPSFGIVTSFYFKTYTPPSTVINFGFNWPAGTDSATAAAIFAAFQQFGAGNSPPQLSLAFKTFNDKSINLGGMYYSSISSLNTTLGVLFQTLPSGYTFGSQTLGWVASLELVSDGQSLETSNETDRRDDFYAKSVLSPSSTLVSNDTLSSFFEYLYSTTTSTEWFVEVNLVGGSQSVINTVSLNTNSFGHRDSLLLWQLYASSSTYSPPFPAEGLTFVQGMYDKLVTPMQPVWGTDYGSYVNYADPSLTLGQSQSLYWGSQYSRLSSLKARYDPKNVFADPQSIVGSTSASTSTTLTSAFATTSASASLPGTTGTSANKPSGSQSLVLLDLQKLFTLALAVLCAAMI